MLQHKGIGYRRAELPLILSRPIVRALRFPRKTVPAMRLGKRRVGDAWRRRWDSLELFTAARCSAERSGHKDAPCAGGIGSVDACS